MRGGSGTAKSDRTLLVKRTSGLGIGQLFVLIFGFLITSALIFVFGIWVGRDVAERRLAQEERVVRVPIPTPPPASEQAVGSGVDLGFYEKIKEKAMQRLERTAAAAASPTPQRVAVPTRARKIVTAPSPPPVPAEHANRPVTAPQAEKGWTGRPWTVQVNATTNLAQAVGLAHRLREKGYDAYTVQAPMHGQTWYRVRVGRFKGRQQAEKMKAHLRKTEGLANAYVTPQ